ncbi:FAD assembly factor SdhE, partial [Sodalis-like symbiont of Bactericera trigonica]
MDITNKSRIHWACRRGMRELDIAIMPFFEYDFDALDDQDRQRFVRLLECDDPDLFNWLMNHGQPDDGEMRQIITII